MHIWSAHTDAKGHELLSITAEEDGQHRRPSCVVSLLSMASWNATVELKPCRQSIKRGKWSGQRVPGGAVGVLHPKARGRRSEYFN
jgi:hypothetical protein